MASQTVYLSHDPSRLRGTPYYIDSESLPFRPADLQIHLRSAIHERPCLHILLLCLITGVHLPHLFT